MLYLICQQKYLRGIRGVKFFSKIVLFLDILPVYDGGKENLKHRIPLPVLVTRFVEIIPGLIGRSTPGFRLSGGIEKVYVNSRSSFNFSSEPSPNLDLEQTYCAANFVIYKIAKRKERDV